MQEEIGYVIEKKGTWIDVAITRKSTCSKCHSSHQCSVAPITQALTPDHIVVTCQTTQTVHIGDQVKLCLPQASVVKAAMLGYLYPLMGFFIGLFIAESIRPASYNTDITALVGGVLGGTLGWLLARYQAKQQESTWQPQITAYLGQPIETSSHIYKL
tara:strand:- start:6534 stop:7007 length:474 start_codon:yes stop_codon:yes gene_type:complete